MNAIREIYEDAPDSITIPESLRHRRVEVVLIDLSSSNERLDSTHWPSGFFEKTFGCIPDFPERESQGKYEQRDELL